MLRKIKPAILPPLDLDFIPVALASRAFLQAVSESGHGTRLIIAIERGSSMVSSFDTIIFADGTGMDDENNAYVERLLKSLL